MPMLHNMVKMNLIRTTFRLTWLVCILLIIACAAPPEKVNGLTYRSPVSDGEYHAMQQKEAEARAKEAEARKYADLIQERYEISNRIIFGLTGFIGMLILSGLGLLLGTIRSLNRATTSLIQQNKDQEKFCQLRHEPIEQFITNQQKK